MGLEPSTGEIKTIRVPRATSKPKVRVVSLPSSSTLSQPCQLYMAQNSSLTSQLFLHIVQDEVHQLVKALQSSSDCSTWSA